jgi:hypothetical protein
MYYTCLKSFFDEIFFINDVVISVQHKSCNNKSDNAIQVKKAIANRRKLM